MVGSSDVLFYRVDVLGQGETAMLHINITRLNDERDTNLNTPCMELFWPNVHFTTRVEMSACRN